MERVKDFVKSSLKSDFSIEKKKEKWNGYTVYQVIFDTEANLGTPIFILENSSGELRYCTNKEVYPILFFYTRDEE